MNTYVTYEASYMYRRETVSAPADDSLQSVMDHAATRLGFKRAELRDEAGRVSWVNGQGEKFRGNYRKLA